MVPAVNLQLVSSMDGEQSGEAAIVAADTAEELPPESEEQALALNIDELRFWVKQVILLKLLGSNDRLAFVWGKSESPKL